MKLRLLDLTWHWTAPPGVVHSGFPGQLSSQIDEQSSTIQGERADLLLKPDDTGPFLFQQARPLGFRIMHKVVLSEWHEATIHGQTVVG